MLFIAMQQAEIHTNQILFTIHRHARWTALLLLVHFFTLSFGSLHFSWTMCCSLHLCVCNGWMEHVLCADRFNRRLHLLYTEMHTQPFRAQSEHACEHIKPIQRETKQATRPFCVRTRTSGRARLRLCAIREQMRENGFYCWQERLRERES